MVLDPNDLAAKGATLLHHLAVWMLEEKRMTEKEGEEQPVSIDLKDPSGQPPGLVTNSIVLLFSIKDWCKKVCFSTKAQSMFASLVVDSVLRLPRLARHM